MRFAIDSTMLSSNYDSFLSLASVVAYFDAPPAPSGDGLKLDPMQLVLNASIPVKIVLIVLALFSVACWFLIGFKALQLGRIRAEAERFLRVFYETRSMDAIAQGITQFARSPLARIFAISYDERERLTHSRAPLRGLSEAEGASVESVARRTAAIEISSLESWMSLLGTIGSTAPFIGLFGTVYGIMDAFLSIGNQQNANLPVVAPKIAEALIATAVGLVAAIPSVIAYNFFARKVQTLADVLEAFTSDISARFKLGGD